MGGIARTHHSDPSQTKMNYCSACGGALVLRTPADDDRPRHVCDRCGRIHYQNPKVVVGSIPQWEDKILLCRRAIEPRHGLWTLPAGFLENGETTQQGAMRETLEEAQARVAITEPYALFNLPDIDQIYLLFRSRLLDLGFGPGPESLEVCLFSANEIPWDELAFPVIKETLALFVEDRRRGHFPLLFGDIRRIGADIGRYQVILHGER